MRCERSIPRPVGRVALRIEIEHQDRLADGCQSGSKIDRGRRLAHAALLVCEREHTGGISEAHSCGQRPRLFRHLPQGVDPPDLENCTLRIDEASMFYQIQVPGVRRFNNL